jgi:hypothetical protein
VRFPIAPSFCSITLIIRCPTTWQGLSLSSEVIDVVIVEAKTNQPCTLNGPWTREDRHNVHRMLAAIGCIPARLHRQAASDIYRAGIYLSDQGLRIRLVAAGRERSDVLAAAYPDVTQLIWTDLLTFIWDRFHTYRQQKTDVHQWDAQGSKSNASSISQPTLQRLSMMRCASWECGSHLRRRTTIETRGREMSAFTRTWYRLACASFEGFGATQAGMMNRWSACRSSAAHARNDIDPVMNGMSFSTRSDRSRPRSPSAGRARD